MFASRCRIGPPTGPIDKGHGVLARQRQGAILREVDRSGAACVSELGLLGICDMRCAATSRRWRPRGLLDAVVRRMVSEQVGQLIVPEPFDGHEDNGPRTVMKS
jgi:hypothetical protein